MDGRSLVTPSAIVMIVASSVAGACGPTVVLPQEDGTGTTSATSIDGSSPSPGPADTGVADSDTGVIDTGVADSGVVDTGVVDTSDGDDDGTTAGVATSTTDGGEETTGTTGVAELCEAPTRLMPCDAGTDDPFAAIGLGCRGGPDESIPLTSSTFESSDPNAWMVAPRFGDAVDPVTGAQIWGPQEGEALLVLSTGGVGLSQSLEFAFLEGVGDNGNPDAQPLPAPMSALPGSNGGAGGTPFANCDGVNDCSETILGMTGGIAYDLSWLQFETEVPAGTHGFTIDFAFFSEEFPEFVGTQFNDAFVVWSNSESYTGNVCIVDGHPCSVTAMWPTQYQNGSPALQSTGFADDGGTAWHRIRGPASPGETLQLTIAVFELGASDYDTLALLDRFAWDCEACDLAADDACVGGAGVAP